MCCAQNNKQGCYKELLVGRLLKTTKQLLPFELHEDINTITSQEVLKDHVEEVMY